MKKLEYAPLTLPSPARGEGGQTEMNLPAASSGVSKTKTGRSIRRKRRGIYPKRNKKNSLPLDGGGRGWGCFMGLFHTFRGIEGDFMVILLISLAFEIHFPEG